MANIKKLTYPMWFKIVFFLLTIVGPILLIVIDSIKASGQGASIFRWTLGIISTMLITWLFIKHFFIKDLKSKLIAKQVALEHDYQTENGNLQNIKQLWHTNEIYLSLLSLVNILLYGGLFIVIIIAVSSGLLTIKRSILIVSIFYVVAYTIKFIMLISVKGASDETDSGSEDTRSC